MGIYTIKIGPTRALSRLIIESEYRCSLVRTEFIVLDYQAERPLQSQLTEHSAVIAMSRSHNGASAGQESASRCPTDRQSS